MTDSSAIAVFDSGLGGLTVVHELKELLPNEKIIYFGDTLRCPYGGRSADAVIGFSSEIVSFLKKFDIKMVVAACNTVSSVALPVLEKELSASGIICQGVVEPGCRAAYSYSSKKRVGVIGTRGTIATHAYKSFLEKMDPSIEVYEKACPLLAPMVEEGVCEGPVLNLILEEYLDELIDFGVDSLVLGCTHYPLIKNAIQAVVGGAIHVIDSAWWTAKSVEKRLKSENLLSSSLSKPDHQFFVTDVTLQAKLLVQPFLSENAELKRVEL